MKVIYDRDVNAYFNSMTGPIVISVLLCFLGIYFMGVNMDSGYPYFSYVLVKVRLIYVLVIPILTMRSFAEERHTKTDQYWMTAPVSVADVVIGKFLAMATVLAVPLMICCLCPMIIRLNGTAYLATDYLAIFVFFLWGCVYIAIGMFISSLTESQIIAAIGTFAVVFLLHMWNSLVIYLPKTAIGSLGGMLFILLLLCAALEVYSHNWVLSAVTFGIGAAAHACAFLFNSAIFAGLLPNLMERLSLYTVFKNFAYYMVFDWSGLILYVSLIALMIYLTVQVIEKRRWD
ncbi:hypothetical protein SDC9_54898 [bioreactor metagenome]|uniref:ABC-2 type transporter domain-containing protein n=1 Tax=bioreactor metagenome TaxID=1076179 RepID=A0A644WXD9_9ZZZZ